MSCREEMLKSSSAEAPRATKRLNVIHWLKVFPGRVWGSFNEETVPRCFRNSAWRFVYLPGPVCPFRLQDLSFSSFLFIKNLIEITTKSKTQQWEAGGGGNPTQLCCRLAGQRAAHRDGFGRLLAHRPLEGHVPLYQPHPAATQNFVLEDTWSIVTPGVAF